jgi:hypothetical protein
MTTETTKAPKSGARVSAPGRTRTCNLLIRSQVLYPLSYGRVLYRRESLPGESNRPGHPPVGTRSMQRRLRDSNPGWAINPNRISSAAP